MKLQRRTSRTGLSLVEVAISTLLTGLVLVSSLKSMNAILRGHIDVGDTARGEHLAHQLLAEIMQQNYREPTELPLFGREVSELLSSRANWDDVDDYHLWSASPPKDRNGNVLPNLTGWEREVSVQYVNPSNPSATSLTDQGVKRITVTVKKNGQVVARGCSLRSDKYTGT